MAEKKKITRKVISRAPTQVLPLEDEEKVEQAENTDEKAFKLKRSCFFCQSRTVPSYTDLVTLRKFLTDRAKIQPKLKSSVCARHQRAVAKHIKYARHLALLPFVPKV